MYHNGSNNVVKGITHSILLFGLPQLWKCYQGVTALKRVKTAGISKHCLSSCINCHHIYSLKF